MKNNPEILAAVLGAVLGVLGGVTIERVARSWGRLWCEPSEWELTFLKVEADKYGGEDRRALPPGEGHLANLVEYKVRLDLFNGKEIPVGLRDARIVFRCADGGEVVSYPHDMDRGPGGSSGRVRVVTVEAFAPLSIINLPPRQWVPKELEGIIREDDNVRRLSQWRQAELVGERQRRGLLEPKTFRKIIASRPPLSDPFVLKGGSG